MYMDQSYSVSAMEHLPHTFTVIPIQRTCNNMFQIAAIWAYCLDRDYDFRVDCSHCKTAAPLLHELGDPFTVGKPLGDNMWDIRKLDPMPLPDAHETNTTSVAGWFQDPRYFAGHEAEIRKLYAPLTGKRKPGTLGIHVRLGDFLSEQFKKDYFSLDRSDIINAYRALESPDVKEVVLFSDEPEKAKELLPKFVQPVRVSAAETPFDVLREMSSCEYLIASNSTMSWWAAWLGDIRHVAVHYPWTKFHPQHGLYLPHWHIYR